MWTHLVGPQLNPVLSKLNVKTAADTCFGTFRLPAASKLTEYVRRQFLQWLSRIGQRCMQQSQQSTMRKGTHWGELGRDVCSNHSRARCGRGTHWMKNVVGSAEPCCSCGSAWSGGFGRGSWRRLAWFRILGLLASKAGRVGADLRLRWRRLLCCGAGRAVAQWGGAAGRPGRRPGVAIPGQMLMSLGAMESAHEPVVLGLARIVQEQQATGLAGMDQHKYA